MINWHIGCSGFYYKHWKGIFYPEDLPQSKWFNFYTEHFKALELNVTFYRFPQLKTLENWHKKSPSGFKFILKANRMFTHYKKFNDVQDSLNDFYGLAKSGLKEKCGGILFQFPPSFHYSEELMEKVSSNMNRDFNNILEFRHESWWRQDVYDYLGKQNITFCGISHPSLPLTVIKNTDLLYYRFHGKQQLYNTKYTNGELKDIYEQIESYKNLKEAFLFFNNDMQGYAIENARTLQEFLQK